MRKHLLYLAILCCAGAALGDTPPARVINAELYDASGNPINSTGGSLNVTTTSSALPSGAATETTLSNLNGKFNSLGQKTMTGSAPVVLPSDQSPIPVTQSGTWLNRITDGTNTAAVKPAATAPTTADPALVVGISPNSPITVTSVPPVNAHVTGSLTDQCPTGTSCPAGSTVQVTTDGYSTVGYEAHGTWSAAVTTDVSFDPLCSATPNAVLWFNTASIDTDTNESVYINTWGASKNNDPWVMNVASAQCARVRASSYTSGSVDLTIDTGVGTAMVWAVNVGNVNSGSADAGGPVKVGGRYNLTPPTFTDGARGDLQLDVNGKLLTALPTDASTATNQATANGSLASIDTKTPALVSGRVPVDGSGVTQPVSQVGTWTVQQGATPTSLANAWPVKPTDGTNTQGYTASSEAKVLVTPLTNSSVVKAQLQDDAGTAVTLGQKVMASSLPVTVASDQTAQADVSTSGSLPSNGSAVALTGTHAMSTAVFMLSGTWTGIVAFEGTIDGSTWYPLQSLNLSALQNGTQTTVNGQFVMSIAGATQVRAHCTSLSAGGPISVSIEASVGVQTVFVQQASVFTARLLDGAGTAVTLGQKTMANSLPVVLASDQASIPVTQSAGPWTQNVTQYGGTNLSTGTGASGAGIPRVTVSNDSNILATQSGTWTVQQGATPTTLANAWSVKPTDGTNAITVKAASTAAIATDTAQVVALSPNTPLPAGTNVLGALSANQSINLVQINGATESATNPLPTRLTDGTNFSATFQNLTNAQATVSSPGQTPVRLALAAGWDGTTHREVAVDTSGDVKMVGSVADASADSGNPVKVGGRYTTSIPSLTNNQRGDIMLDKQSNVRVNNGGTSFVAYGTPAQTGTVIKSGAGRLITVCLMTKGANTDTLQLWDNTAASGTVLVDTTLSGAATPLSCAPLNVDFSTGLTITTTGTTSRWTIVYE